MGNSIGGRKKAKVMKVDGETIKLKTPVQVSDVVKDYPGYVLLDSEAVKHFGIRAKPLEPQQQLKPRKIYFLVELPKFPEEKVTRRVRSGIQMSAKDRLECLMLSRRAVSDLSAVATSASSGGDGAAAQVGESPMRVKLKLPKSQLEKLVDESRDGGEVAEKIIDLYMEKTGVVDRGGQMTEAEWKTVHGRVRENVKARDQKRVSFVSEEGESLLNIDAGNSNSSS